MHLANKYITSILSHPKNKITEEKTSLELAALLHDIAHGPYSHAFDSTVYSEIYDSHKGHDIHRLKILNCFDLNREEIKKIWKNEKSHLSAVISGPLSVDRMDFTLRDSFYTGVNYGIFDIGRIVNNCWFDYVNDKAVLVYDSKIVKSALQGLSSRLYMYEEIYLHKKVVAASILIECMILKSFKHLKLVEKVEDIDKFIYLNDESLFNEILFSNEEELKDAKYYAKLLYERKLPKLISEKRIVGEKNTPGIQFLENSEIKWTSRILTKDFVSEFEKFDIHISKNDKLYRFKDYITDISKESYYFERIYKID